MKMNQKRQYTIRNIPPQLDRTLKQKTRDSGKSLNQVVLDLLQRSTGLVSASSQHHDLDSLVGTWKEDPAFDEVLKLQDQIDPKLQHFDHLPQIPRV